MNLKRSKVSGWLQVVAVIIMLGVTGSVAVSADFPRDEVSDLVDKLKPAARFAKHKAQFSVARESHAFEQLQGPQTWDFWVIKDADRYVAVVPLQGFHSGTIYMQAFQPGLAPKKLSLPTERWHIDTAVGTELQTFAFIPNPDCEQEKTFEFKTGDGTLTMVRRYAGTTTFNRWEHRDKQPQRVDVTNTFLFRCDPVLGYVVEATYDVKAERFPAQYQFTSHAQSGRYALWPGEATCFRNVVTPIGQEGYAGYYMNLPSISAGRLSCRNRGFAGFLNDQTGWSTVTTCVGGDAPIGVCNAHADLDLATIIPKDLAAGEDGLKRWVQHHRLLALPPELTKHVWDSMDVMFRDRKKLQVRLGRLEDFDDQPLSLTTRDRGLAWTSEDPALSTAHARSGKQSLVVRGGVWPNIPQIALKPNRKYRVEAWYKVDPVTDEQLKALEEKARDNLAKENEKRAKKNQPPREFAGIGAVEAFIKADLYEWTPHANKWEVEQRTTSAKPGVDGWQKVSLEFTTPKWGPFVNIVFVANNCTAYLDDFQFVEVAE
jgi:hypothetical protein